jgi:hypothetical protein
LDNLTDPASGELHGDRAAGAGRGKHAATACKKCHFDRPVGISNSLFHVYITELVDMVTSVQSTCRGIASPGAVGLHRAAIKARGLE